MLNVRRSLVVAPAMFTEHINSLDRIISKNIINFMGILIKKCFFFGHGNGAPFENYTYSIWQRQRQRQWRWRLYCTAENLGFHFIIHVKYTVLCFYNKDEK